MFFLIGDDSHRPAADAGVSAKQSLAILRAILLKFAGIHSTRDDFAHVILFPGIARENSINVLGGIKRIARMRVTEGSSVWPAQFIRQRANSCQARFVVGLAKIYGAADLRVHFRATQIFG